MSSSRVGGYAQRTTNRPGAFGRNRTALVYRCLDCDSEFNREDKAQEHVRDEHPIAPLAPEPEPQTVDFEQLALEHELRTALTVQRVVGAGAVLDRLTRWMDKREQGDLTIDQAEILRELKDVLDNQMDIVRRGAA